MATLTGPRRDAKEGPARSLVIFLHGYGADGNDLIGLADPLAKHMPGTAFRAPDAPERCRVNPMGRQWFPIPWIDGSTEAERDESAIRSFEVLNRYLGEAMEEEGVSAQHTALVGFSQGTMMSLHVGPRRPDPVAGIVGFSGRLLLPERLAEEALSKPPVLLVHGDLDEMIPVAALKEAHDGLEAAGFDVKAHVSQGTPHAIAPDGLGLALAFLTHHLGTAAAA